MINEVAGPNFLLFYNIFTDCCYSKRERKKNILVYFVFSVQENVHTEIEKIEIWRLAVKDSTKYPESHFVMH